MTTRHSLSDKLKATVAFESLSGHKTTQEIAASLGKIGQDIGMMAQRGPKDITFSSSGSSLAMPHKQTPNMAELLATIAHNFSTTGGPFGRGDGS